MKRGKIFVVSGFSGAGKGTIMKNLMKKGCYSLSVSCTSRMPREGEKDGVDYFFISYEEFLRLNEQGYFLESTDYVGKAYGTPKKFVEDRLAEGKDVILEIEMNGGMEVKKKYPDTVMIFITPPSAEELRNRLYARGTESPEEIQKRLERAAMEGRYMEQYDYIVVNDDLDETVEQLHNLMQSMHFSTASNMELVNEIKNELTTFKKGE